MPRCFIYLLAVIFLITFPVLHFSEENRIITHFERIGPFGGDVRSLLLDSKKKGVVLLGTSDGRIFRSSDSGRSWISLKPGIGPYEYVIDTLVQHPSEADHIYAGAWDLHSEGGGLFESKDGGLTWARIVLAQGPSAVRGFAICNSSPKYMIAGTLSGAYISSDGGRNWKHVGGRDLEKAESVAIDPKDYRSLYVGTWRLGYKSIDFGRTWTKVDKGMPLDSDLFSIAINSKNPEIVYASACSGVYRSANGAMSWTRMRLLPDRFTVRAQAVYIDPTDPQKIYVGTTEGLFVSPDDGAKWERLTPQDVTVNAIQIDPNDGRRILIGTEYNGLLLSENGGQKWEEANAGFVHRQISWILPDSGNPRQFFGGLQSGSGGFLVYDVKSHSWAQSQIEPGMRIFSFLILPDNRGVLAGTSAGIYRQTQIDAPWQKLAGLIGKRAIYSLEIDPSGSIVYAGTDQGIYKSSLPAFDFRVPPDYRFSPKVWCIKAAGKSSGLIYAGTSLGLFRSRNKGTTWNLLNSFGLPDRVVFESLAISPLDSNRLFAGTSAGLFVSNDGGNSWNRAGDERMRADIPSVIFLDGSEKKLLAANKSSGGVFISADGGINWDLIYSPGNDSPVYCIMQDPDNSSAIFLGTRSDGVYLLNLSGNLK
jgi:photosystem II stability/assembly factor-like uncharacterized protein